METEASASGGSTVQAGYFHEQEPKAKMLMRALAEKHPAKERKNLAVYALPLTEKVSGLENGQRKYSFGQETVKVNEKVILMVGESGSGKSTLINAMMNYLLGVEFEDQFRFKLIDEDVKRSQAQSQTATVTAYEVQSEPGLRISYPVTVVDTPGFGDTGGLGRDRETVKQLTECFSSLQFIAHLNVVCFVISACLPRLTAAQKYIFSSVLSIFGKDIAENILFMFTFADSSEIRTLAAIEEARLPCIKGEDGAPLHYSFNNGALFNQNDELSRLLWKKSMGSMKSFFHHVEYLGPKSLTLTKEVLTERAVLDATLQVLVPEIKAGLAVSQALRMRAKALKENLDTMEENKMFTLELDVVVKEQEAIETDSAMNCQVCDVTCHYPCKVVGRPFNYFCEVIGLSGNCKVCPSECKVGDHKLEKHKWVTRVMTHKEEVKDVKGQYESAYKEVMTGARILEKMEDEIAAVKQRVLQHIEKATKCLGRLKEIALMPEQIDCSDYMDLMAIREQAAGEPGFQDRIMNLMELKQYTEILKKVERNQNLLPDEEHIYSDYKEMMKRVSKEGVKALFCLCQRAGKTTALFISNKWHKIIDVSPPKNQG
ncbi:uncharacterized protein [Pleurodeles waltl]|uniref:uncharacterized protein n=1 Tax=Pleurodeles waltl TaxID=8319 RepID=UPI003709857F